MTARDYRETAWNKLEGQWSTMALVALVQELIVGAASALGGVGTLFVGGPLSYSVQRMALNISRGKQEKFESMFDGFEDYVRTMCAGMLIYAFTFLWSLLFIVPGIVAAYAYSMTYFIMADNPQISPNEARKQSVELMRGNKWKLFCLDMSFIGWYLLGILTCGILFYWIIPYQNTAYAEFYRELVPETEKEKEEIAGTQADGTREVKTCAYCGTSDVASSAFCTNCGAKMSVAAEPKATSPTVYCTNCGAKNKPDSAFCTSCGAKIK